MASEHRFGYEWNKYNKIDPNYEGQFLKWVYPLKINNFKNKKILDAGCGMGRNSFWPLKYGAKEVVGFDCDEYSIKAAKRNLSRFNNTSVEFKNIYELPWENEFDVAFSIGVIHHLKNPKLAINNLIKTTKPGGIVLIWVYGYEGNEWITKIVSPVRRKITSKLPVNLVHFLSYFPSIPVWLCAKMFGGPGGYLRQLSNFRFWHTHSIVFDQLIPEVANYWKKDEAFNLLKNSGKLRDIKIHRVNNNSWTVLGVKR